MNGGTTKNVQVGERYFIRSARLVQPALYESAARDPDQRLGDDRRGERSDSHRPGRLRVRRHQDGRLPRTVRRARSAGQRRADQHRRYARLHAPRACSARRAPAVDVRRRLVHAGRLRHRAGASGRRAVRRLPRPEARRCAADRNWRSGCRFRRPLDRGRPHHGVTRRRQRGRLHRSRAGEWRTLLRPCGRCAARAQR